jgi:signal peptidase I
MAGASALSYTHMKVLYRVLAEYMAESERKYFMSYKPDEDKIPEVETEIKETSERDKAVPAEESDFEMEEPYNAVEHDPAKPKPAHRTNSRGLIYDLIFYASLIFVCIYILPNFVIQRTIVDGSSMENTLFNGEQLYVEKLSYRFDALKRFDIIVFYPYGRENKEYYVKRIIGLPGETVQIIGSDIYINGEILEEDYGKEPITDSGRAAEPVTLGEDEYFVLGDNRKISKDSRFDEVGNVKKENIGGRAILRIKPLSKFGPID